jgi:coenzyme PQQ biosynthesis protein PqqD
MCANMISMDAQSRPALARGVRLRNDPITGEPVLLFPEGVLPLDAAMHDILIRCSGQATVASIILSLVEEYETDPKTVGADVCECLAQLRQRMLVANSP